ncbi:unnamed protein product [Gordionus sp. m RMFG-2023]
MVPIVFLFQSNIDPTISLETYIFRGHSETLELDLGDEKLGDTDTSYLDDARKVLSVPTKEPGKDSIALPSGGKGGGATSTSKSKECVTLDEFGLPQILDL